MGPMWCFDVYNLKCFNHVKHIYSLKLFLVGEWMVVLWMEPGASDMLSKHSTTKLNA